MRFEDRPMSHRVCPWWVGYLLLSPLRRLVQDPRAWLGPFVREGMVVLEPGPGMGFYTLDVARMVGPSGRVVAVDVQEKMLAALRRRAVRAGLADRIDLRRARPDGLGIDDLAGRVDLVVAIFVVHEMADAESFFAEAWRALRPGGRLLFAEPRLHVPRKRFERAVAAAERAGFAREEGFRFPSTQRAVFARPAS